MTQCCSSAAMAAGHLAHYLGDDDAAVVPMEESLALARAVDAPVLEAFATVMLGIVAEDSGDYATARRRFDSAREQYGRADHPRGSALATYHLGVVAYGEEDPILAT